MQHEFVFQLNSHESDAFVPDGRGGSNQRLIDWSLLQVHRPPREPPCSPRKHLQSVDSKQQGGQGKRQALFGTSLMNQNLNSINIRSIRPWFELAELSSACACSGALVPLVGRQKEGSRATAHQPYADRRAVTMLAPGKAQATPEARSHLHSAVDMNLGSGALVLSRPDTAMLVALVLVAGASIVSGTGCGGSNSVDTSVSTLMASDNGTTNYVVVDDGWISRDNGPSFGNRCVPCQCMHTWCHTPPLIALPSALSWALVHGSSHTLAHADRSHSVCTHVTHESWLLLA
jgi:hypothetical protein